MATSSGGSFFYLPKTNFKMNFKFLQIKLNTYKEEYNDKLKFIDSKDEATMYTLEEIDKRKLFGYYINSIKLYFHQLLVSVSYRLEVSIDEYPDLIDCISLVTGQNPQMSNDKDKNFLKWIGNYELLYCFPEFEKREIQLYHTLKDYDIVE